jgi:hypothetical protein
MGDSFAWHFFLEISFKVLFWDIERFAFLFPMYLRYNAGIVYPEPGSLSFFVKCYTEL